ncbi:MAG: nucleotide 5'-monophosphate nucleosidase PpnN [Methylococcaceae bacterium]|nr:nucleotide 5'-monophosphate nucleosidase PpnN [Methylococcaceae bacterium]
MSSTPACQSSSNHSAFDPETAKTAYAEIGPRGSLELLSQRELTALIEGVNHCDLQELFRRCSLAVMNTGNECDDATQLFDFYRDFSIEVARRTRGLKLIIRNAPRSAFIEGRMVEGIRQHLFAVLRDIVYIGTEISDPARYDLTRGSDITDAIFHILKHAHVMQPGMNPRVVVCWGGHSIPRDEYDYTKEVGYQLGLRGFDICTGCGPGAMKGPMKGAAVGHTKQRNREARYLGLTETGIIAAEPPNPMVSDLVILPDIEKRLEAFLRLGHAIVVFPGGVGTAEEILYLMGILLAPANAGLELPVIFTGPSHTENYFAELDRFLTFTLGENVRGKYEVILADPVQVGRSISRKIEEVRKQRRRDGDAYYFNWLLTIPETHQAPFDVNHDSVARLKLSRTMPVHELAVEIRRAFSAIVTGNVKEHGIRMIQKHGPLRLRGDAELVEALDRLLRNFTAQGRMKLNGEYRPCYTIARSSGP